MADWPNDYTRGDFAAVLERGETTRYAWGGGVMVCLRSDESNPAGRLTAIRLAGEEVQRARDTADLSRYGRMHQ
jgi:hypothetical protein